MRGHVLLLAGTMMISLHGEAAPAAQVNTGGGVTLYVSKLGDNSDGSSWAKAFTTIQAALDAIPNADGGHRIVLVVMVHPPLPEPCHTSEEIHVFIP